MTGAAGLAAAFERAKSQGRAAVIAYLPAGFPDKQTSIDLIRAITAQGVDIVEVGIPYSDPVMDGPIICRAAEIALAAGTTTPDVIDVVAACADGTTAVLVMSYWNLIEQHGAALFAADLAAAGGAGTITPDLTPEEAREWIAGCDAEGLAHVFLAAPSSDDDRLREVVGAASGFVYAASLMGVTGVRSVGAEARILVDRLREFTDLPIAVGLGVSTGEQARSIAQYADGVIVGSAFVKRVLDAPDAEAALAGVADLARELMTSVQRQ